MSDANAGGAAHDAMIRVEENSGAYRPGIGAPNADPEVWMLLGTLASALEDLLDERPERAAPYARTALQQYQDMKARNGGIT